MRSLLFYISFFACTCSATAQVGTSQIAISSIGNSTLRPPAVGLAATPACSFPGGTCSTGLPVYIFTGEGDWDNPANWKNFVVPPAVLPAQFEIMIDPKGSKECVLNIPQQVIQAGATITVAPGKKLRLPGQLKVNQ